MTHSDADMLVIMISNKHSSNQSGHNPPLQLQSAILPTDIN
jgi:hypothetical protein